MKRWWLMLARFGGNIEEVPPHGKGMPHIDLRHYALQTIPTLELFYFKNNHKPLEWLAAMSDAQGRKGRWMDMLQDFNFKILHQLKLKHTNVDALSKNPMGVAIDDDNFNEEIQDIGSVQANTHEVDDQIFFIQTSKGSEWLGFKR
jgi:hypothetical protein